MIPVWIHNNPKPGEGSKPKGIMNKTTFQDSGRKVQKKNKRIGNVLHTVVVVAEEDQWNYFVLLCLSSGGEKRSCVERWKTCVNYVMALALANWKVAPKSPGYLRSEDILLRIQD